MCDYLNERKWFLIRKATRQVKKDCQKRIVYTMNDKAQSMTLEAFQDIGLDELGAIRVCVIGPVDRKHYFQRYRYDKKRDKFMKV